MPQLNNKGFVLVAICGFMILLSCTQKPSSENKVAQDVAITPAKKPEWLKGPIVMKGSNQEPLIFQVRRGNISRKVKENYLRSHTVENVKEMEDFGGTFFMSHVFKGFGIEAEREDIELAKKLSPIA